MQHLCNLNSRHKQAGKTLRKQKPTGFAGHLTIPGTVYYYSH